MCKIEENSLIMEKSNEWNGKWSRKVEKNVTKIAVD